MFATTSDRGSRSSHHLTCGSYTTSAWRVNLGLAMDLEHIQRLSARSIVDTLDSLGITEGWAIGDELRAAAMSDPDVPALPEPNRGRNQAFQNLVVGTIAERVFREQHLAPLEADGFTVVDYHEAGENRDYGLQRDGQELPINVKVASTLFRNAKTTVGLEPEDCVPISAYKAIGASERVPTLVYVDLVDFTLRDKVDAFMDALEGDLEIGWYLFSWYGGVGAKRTQDRYIDVLFDAHEDELKALAPGSTSFRVISAQRVLAILRSLPRRVPGLGVPGAGTGTFVAEVNVHVSVEAETRPWGEVANECRHQGIPHVLAQITRRVMAEIPDPRL